MSDILEPRGYGWKPDLPDVRDINYKIFRAVDPSKLPALVDLRPGCPPVYDQGRLGSCTANALGAAYQFSQLKQKKKSTMPSRLFIYYNERVLERTVNSDAGAMIRDGIKTICKEGVSPEELWPYDITKFTRKPTVKAYQTAVKNTVTQYARLDNSNILQLKNCLAEGFPFVFGFTVYSFFESREMSNSGMLQLPSSEDKVLGGHAVMAVGYDDTKQAFIIRNSWGTQWGMQGYFYMPYAYITNPNLATDFWTVRFVTN